MTCEVCMCLVMYIVTFLSRTIFSNAGDRLAQKLLCMLNRMIYLEFYDVVRSILVCCCVGFDRLFLYNILWWVL